MKRSSELFFRNLIALQSPSGFEADAAKLFASYVAKAADAVQVDLMGNTIAEIRPKTPTEFTVMFSAHIDEIGLMVRYVDEKGFIYFAAIGGIDVRLLLGQRVTIHTDAGKVRGVIGHKPIHLMDAAEGEKTPKIYDLFIDIGAKDKKETLRHVAIGDPVTVDGELEKLLNGLYVGRGFDDRMGVFCLAELVHELHANRDRLKVNVKVVASVQEEIGLRGAHAAAYHIKPDVGIAVDVGFATDFPSVDPKRIGEARCGGGPIIARGPNINHKLYDLATRTAKKHKIPCQPHAEPRGTGTDANVIQLSRGGVAAGLVSVPLRYMHTNVEVLSGADLEHTIQLLRELTLQLKPGMDFRPY